MGTTVFHALIIMDRHQQKGELMSLVHNKLQKEITSQQTDFYKEQNNCSLCGSELQLEVYTDFSRRTGEEKASCISCNLPLWTKTFLLQ